MQEKDTTLVELIRKNLKRLGISTDNINSFLALFSAEEVEQIPQVAENRIKLKQEARVKLIPQNRPVIRLRSPNEVTSQSSESVELNSVLQGLINVQANEFAKVWFTEKARQRLGRDFVDTQGKGNDRWCTNNNLMRLANEFGIPFMAIEHLNHWHLMLSEPKVKLGHGFGVYVYDPKKNGEIFLPLPWSPSQQKNWKSFLGINIPVSIAGKSLVDRGKYNLQLGSESKGLQRIKGARKQFDEWNCGPISLFQAALLSAVVNSNEPEIQTFRQTGLNGFEKAYGIDILTREEIMDDASN